MALPRTDIETAMRHALDLASRGPVVGGNPQVGCVLLDTSGAIVAEGWHRGAGTPHAEADALARLRSSLGLSSDPAVSNTGHAAGHATGYASGLTAVVTLEPCNHTGRTGPCAEALINAGVSEVYFAVSDPSHLASGGAARLEAAGIPATGGILLEPVSEFLHPWLTATRLGRPYVTVKWASTLDGRAAASDGTSQWITGTAARQRVHEQREANDAILVGTGTVLADNPSLTARGDAGELMEHQPVPVVVGKRDMPADAHLRNHPAGLIETHSRDLPGILEALFQRGIRRAFVEGGPQLASALIAADLVDEYAVYLAPSILGGSGLAIGDIGVPSLSGIKHLDILGVEQLGNDLLVRARARPRIQPGPHPHPDPAATPQPTTSTTAGTAASTTAADTAASTTSTARTTTER